MDYEQITDVDLRPRADGRLGLVLRIPGRVEYFLVSEEILEGLQGQIQSAFGDSLEPGP